MIEALKNQMDEALFMHLSRELGLLNYYKDSESFSE
jgi:hypothetical protein